METDVTPFDSIMAVGRSCKDAPDHVLVVAVDDKWWFAVNGNSAPRMIQAPQWGEIEVPPYQAAIFYNGWLAGLQTPYGGVFVAGTGANAEVFDAACRKLAMTGG